MTSIMGPSCLVTGSHRHADKFPSKGALLRFLTFEMSTRPNCQTDCFGRKYEHAGLNSSRSDVRSGFTESSRAVKITAAMAGSSGQHMKSWHHGGRGGGCPRVRAGEGQWTVGGHRKVLTFGPCGLPGVIQDVRGAQKKRKKLSVITRMAAASKQL